jgi:hypothetical protein
VETDHLDIGSTASRLAHDDISSSASDLYELASRFEGGIDHDGGKELRPILHYKGRVTTGTSEFSLKINPSNQGVLLRRTLDYGFYNQRARVYVADSTPGGTRWDYAGTWYLAGSTACVYSNPPGELDPVNNQVEISDQALREDEFLLPLSLTRNRKSVRIRLEFAPRKKSAGLFPGYPGPSSGWSEISYSANCWIGGENRNGK